MPAPGHEHDFSHAAGQPLRDLSVIHDVAPPILQQAAKGPYDTASLRDCRAARAEIRELDAALGPDLSVGERGGGVDLHGLASGLIEGAVGLPFRGVVRQFTGAQRQDQALRAAILAGMVRRGFIKGRLLGMGCTPA